ncbi:MAG: TonB-dependent receptor family protein [Saprospiraceae bacterium]
MKKLHFLIALFSLVLSQTNAQRDSVSSKNLPQIQILDESQFPHPARIAPFHGINISLAGKKVEVVDVSAVNANIAEKNVRQIFAKIPGAFGYDMDGSGNQVNFATRGLDPHRSWEYNVRQNGVVINSDLYGYPASHYSPPMEAISRIEMTRGTAALQYGIGFGGLINYVTKQPDTTRALSGQSIVTVGSFGLFSAYQSLGGRSGRWTWQAYAQKRVSEGYRRDAQSVSDAQYAMVRFEASRNLSIKAEVSRSYYRFRVPGPLTDSMFRADPRQTTRQRNFYAPEIWVPALSFDWRMGQNTRLTYVSSALYGARNSVLFVGLATVPDVINPNTGQYPPRFVDIDLFRSHTQELRLSHNYQTGRIAHTLHAGMALLTNRMIRRQRGQGTTGITYDLTLANPVWGRDLRYNTDNISLFAENTIKINERLSFTPGVRAEYGRTDMSGRIVNLPDENVPASIPHRFPLFGLNGQYDLNPDCQLYGSWSQAYRPVLFADIIPATPLDRSDPNLRDSKGHVAELGLRGRTRGNRALSYDLTAFVLNYIDRVGALVVPDAQTGQNIVLRTNTGDTRTYGLELSAEWRLYNDVARRQNISLFNATAWYRGEYLRGNAIVSGENRELRGNRLEGLPEWIVRSGLNMRFDKLSLTLQYSYVSESFSDALNTPTPSSDGARGPVPAYGLADINASWFLQSGLRLRAGLHNAFDKQYFTKRPTIYPGPGVWPSDGRSFTLALELSF